MEFYMVQTVDFLKEVQPDKSYRLLNIGATGIVSAVHDGVEDLMPAAWICPLDLLPFKVTAVIDKSHFTRPLIEKSGFFGISLPTVSVAKEMMYLGTISKNDEKDKVEKSGAEIFRFPGYDIPFMRGCAAYMIFKLVPEEHNQKTYDLFIGECLGAWADERVFRDGHWIFEQADPSLSTVHYVAGSHFYTMGRPHDVLL